MNAFTVVSEFKFDVAQAVMQSEQLQGSVDKLSNAVDNAVNSMKQLGLSFLASNIGGGMTGMIGMIYSAITASDKFTQSQLSFTQIIDSNMAHLTGTIHTMNDKMLVSKKILGDIQKDAVTFGLPAHELAEMTKSLSAVLAPKGLSGENFGMARSMSRNLLKSAPLLNVHPAEVQGQLMRSIGDNSGGQASMGDTLFRRLIAEAPEAFKNAKVKDAKGFNALDMAKRVNVLNDAMGKFTKNTSLLEARANTVSGALQRIKDLFYGFTSILKPLGDAIIPPLIKLLNIGIEYLNTKGRELVKIMGKFMEQLLEDPKKLFMEIDAMRDLGKNFKLAGEITGAIMLFMHLKEILGWLSKLPIGGKFFAWIKDLPIFANFMSLLKGSFTGLGKVFSFIAPYLKPLLSGLAQFGGLVLVLTAAFHGISRAFSAMKLGTLEWFSQNIVSLTETFLRLKDALAIIFAPITWIADGFFELTYALLGGTYVLDGLKTGFENFTTKMEGLALVVGQLYAAFRGLVAGMFDIIFRAVDNLMIMIKNVTGGNFLNPMKGTQNIFGGVNQAIEEEFTSTMDKFSKKRDPEAGVDGANVSSMVINQDIKMQNSFKEVLQPDRIAFTIADQLKKSATNKTQARPSNLTKAMNK